MSRWPLALFLTGLLGLCGGGTSSAWARPLVGDPFSPNGVDVVVPVTIATPAAVVAAPVKAGAQEIEAGDPTKPNIALTFDAGAGAGPALKLLDILRQKQVHSTFFMTGQFARQNVPLVKEIVAEGHELANHTFDHQDLTTLSDAAAASEITRGEDTISAIAGVSTRPLFRFPYGARNPHLQTLVASLGYRSIYWTVDSLDWEDQATVQSITSRVLGGGKNGAIVLMHVGGTYTTTALPNIIDTLRARGFSLVTATEVAQ